MVELISVHIGKTAGTAFRQILLDVYGSDGVLGDYPPNKVYNPESNLPDSVKVIHGHFPAKKYKKYFSEARRIVWLRHPIFRLISEYFFAQFAQNKKKNSMHAELLEKKLGILEFAKIPGMNNRLSYYVDRMSLKDFYFVGIQEFYIEDLMDLREMMNWQDIQIPTKNINQFPGYQQNLQLILSDSKLMNQLASINEKDMELYKNALDLRAERRNESRFLQSTLADWSRSQFLLQQTQQDLETHKTELGMSQKLLGEKYVNNSRKLELTVFPKNKVDSLADFRIESPQPNSHLCDTNIILKGWVVGKESSPSTLVITFNDTTVKEAEIRLPTPRIAKRYPGIAGVENCRFQASLSVLEMQPGSELLIQVVLDNMERIQIGTIKIIE